MESCSPIPGQPKASRFAALIFTDIVGSTELNARHGVEAYSAALRVHNQAFARIASECHGIRILREDGDGYFAKADSVAEAVKLALLFQEAMRAEGWGEVRLTTRIGIHAGEIKELDIGGGSSVVAPAANIASRVMSLATGGQILLTRFPFEEARHFLREHPPVAGKIMPPLRWLAHGSYLLKGSDEPVDIFEVGPEGMAPLVPPPDGEKAKRAVRPSGNETLDASLSKGRLERTWIRRDFLCGILALLVALLFKVVFEQTPWGIAMERWVSAQLQLALSGKTSRGNELLIVDISGIKPKPVDYPPFPGEEDSREATPREKLSEIVGTIVNFKPRVIAIDVDFSAWEDGRPVTPNDADFFDEILRMSESSHIPVYLGVSRQRWKEPNLWLGEKRFRQLAASIDAPKEPETRYYVRWQRGTRTEEAIPSLALALAGRAQDAGRDDRHESWRWALRSSQMRQAVPPFPESPSPGEMNWALMDYSPLKSLENQFLSVVRVGTLKDNKLKFRDNMVLIGDASEPQHHDHFNIGDMHPEPLAGIYLHACAAITALSGPLLELTPLGRFAGYFAFALATMGAISVTQLMHSRFRSRGCAQSSLSFLSITGLAVLISCMSAVALIRYCRLIWTDFAAIALGLLLHLYMRHRGNFVNESLNRVPSYPVDAGKTQT